MTLVRPTLGLVLGLVSMWSAIANEGERAIPNPLTNHPGNIFLVGEEVVVALPGSGDGNSAWQLSDYEGQTVIQGSATNGHATLGKLPAGYYELRRLRDGRPEKARTTIGVLAPLRAPTPQTSPIGVDVSMAWYFSGAQQEGAANLCTLAGINWVRDRLSWREMEPVKGQFPKDSKYDDTARKQAQAGLRMLQVHHDSPPWASKNWKRQPTDLRDAYHFMEAMARRWRGKVTAFEPWNEGDIPIFGEHTGAELAACQKACYLGLKAGNPNVIVCDNVFASPQPNVLADFNANFAWPYFDTFNLHHYCVLEEYPAVYAAFRAISAGKPLWVSEFNIPVLWPAGDSEQEPSPENLRLQAERVGQLFASSLSQGPAVSFYFLLPHFYEGQNQFGLLHKDLTPRPGYLALAAVGRLLADAKPLGRLRVDGNARAFVFRARPDGEERDVVVAWSPGGKAVLKLPDKPLETFDHLGRFRTNQSTRLELSTAPIFAIYKRDSFQASSLQPPPAKPPIKTGKPSAIVLQAVIPQEKVVASLSAYRCSSARPETFSIFAYNFGREQAAGDLTATFPEGLKVELPGHVELAAGERRELTLTLDCRGGMTTPADTVRISGNFGAAGEVILALRLSPEPFTIVNGPSVPVRAADDLAQWQSTVSAGGELKVTTNVGGDMIFTALVAGADRWVYPGLVLRDKERPPADSIALVATLTALEGGANFRCLFETENHSAYFADFYPQPKLGETVEAVVMPATAIFVEGSSRPDGKEKLELGNVRTIRIGGNPAGEKVVFSVKPVRWIKGGSR
ncbi:MAG: hypothetical protein QOJ40_2307 [Verrucomicrobiota bacterium]